MKKQLKNYAAVYKFGETTVYIDDSCVVKTPEERDQILEEIRLEGIQILREEAKSKNVLSQISQQKKAADLLPLLHATTCLVVTTV